jgi:hypothetical protein
MFIPVPGGSNEQNQPPQTPANADNTNQQAAMDEVIQYVLECLNRGSSQAEVRKQLIASGMSAQDANEIVQQVASWRHKNPGVAAGGGNSGQTSMAIGGIVCLAGIAITVISFMSAQGGGTYVVAWGAIIFGAIQFIRGASQSQQGNG